MTETKINMKGKYKTYKCDPCENEGITNEDSQGHIYICPVLMKENHVKFEVIPKFEYIFTNDTHNMKKVNQIFTSNFKIREKFKIE